MRRKGNGSGRQTGELYIDQSAAHDVARSGNKVAELITCRYCHRAIFEVTEDEHTCDAKKLARRNIDKTLQKKWTGR